MRLNVTFIRKLPILLIMRMVHLRLFIFVIKKLGVTMKMCRCMKVVDDENGLFRVFVFLKSGIPRQVCRGREIIENGCSTRLTESWRCLECNSAECEF